MNDGPGLVANLISTVVALIAVLALAWVSLKLLKRMQQRRMGGEVARGMPRILGSVGLGPRERLVTVRYRGRDYLLGVTAGGISCVESHALDEPEAGAEWPRRVPMATPLDTPRA